MEVLRYKGNDLIVFHVLDPAEIEFPFDEVANYQDLETEEANSVRRGLVRGGRPIRKEDQRRSLGRLDLVDDAMRGVDRTRPSILVPHAVRPIHKDDDFPCTNQRSDCSARP